MKISIILVLILFISNISYSDMLRKKSVYSFKDTVEKIENIIDSKNMEILAKIDHAKSAEINKLYMPASLLIIFGNAQFAASIIQDNPAWGFFFPLKVAIYDDGKGNIWVAVPDVKKIENAEEVSREQREKIRALAIILEMMIKIP